MNIGLVLSGGMAKGAYQIGALRAVNAFIPTGEIKYISCSSVGVLNGYAFACEKLDKAEEMWKNLCCDESRLLFHQIIKSSLLQRNIKDICSDDDRFSAKLYCALFDATHKTVVYKNLSSAKKENIPLYLRASVALPVYNRAVRIDGVSYFDGAPIDNIPVFPLLNCEPDYVICVYFDNTCYKFESARFDDRIIKITFPEKSVFKQNFVFCRDDIEKMISDGFDLTSDVLSSVFRKGYTDLDCIRKTIERRNRSEKRSLRITGDVLATNLNKAVQRFVKRKIEL